MSEVERIEDGGSFSASPIFGHDVARTRAALISAGSIATQRFLREAIEDPQAADSTLLRRIHGEWFGDAFPNAAGVFRRVVVVSRRPTVSAPDAIPQNVAAAFFRFDDDWVAAGGSRSRSVPPSANQVGHLIWLANEITVRLHHIHPFLDGNTRACFLLRAYLLRRAGFPPALCDVNEPRLRAAWNAAGPGDHDALDQQLYDDLAAGFK